MAGIDWFRWHHGSVTDPKFQLVARRAGASLPDVLAVWAYILETASAATQRGSFGDIDSEALDCIFGFPEDETRTANILAAMQARGLVDGQWVVAWERRQPNRERDDSGAAERKQRQRMKENAGNEEQSYATSHHVTPCHAKKSLEESRGDKSREESSNPPTLFGADSPQFPEPQPPESPEPPAPPPKKSTGAKRRSQINPQFFPNENGEAKAAELGLTLDVELTKFRDYHTAKGTVMADWDAAWRTWIGNARKPPQSAQSAGYETPYQRTMRERVAAFAPGVARKAPGLSPSNLAPSENRNVVVN